MPLTAFCGENHFNPRSPHGERRYNFNRRESRCGFQSTLPARGATAFRWGLPRPFPISIHAPRTGSDLSSTAFCLRRQDFNPRSPHGERRGQPAHAGEQHRISIHAPRTGSDDCFISPIKILFVFQSTLPARGATSRPALSRRSRKISIHAPRTGSDPPSPPFGRCR